MKLRVQNPNDTPVEFDGVALNLDVQGRVRQRCQRGNRGRARFGETIVSVPVTVSMLRMVRQVAGMLDGRSVDKITYAMSGKLSGMTLFSTRRFSATGEFALPQEPSPDDPN